MTNYQEEKVANSQKTIIRILSPLYLAYAFIALVLLWISSLSFRVFVRNDACRLARVSKWTILRILAKHGAKEFGYMLPLAILISAIFAGCILQTLNAFLGGAVFGFIFLTLFPVLMPMPSRYMAKL